MPKRMWKEESLRGSVVELYDLAVAQDSAQALSGGVDPSLMKRLPPTVRKLVTARQQLRKGQPRKTLTTLQAWGAGEDPFIQAKASELRALAHNELKHAARAAQAFEAAAVHYESAGLGAKSAVCLLGKARCLLRTGKLREAKEIEGRCMEMAARFKLPNVMGLVLRSWACQAMQTCEWRKSRLLLEDSIRSFEEGGVHSDAAVARLYLAMLALRNGMNVKGAQASDVSALKKELKTITAGNPDLHVLRLALVLKLIASDTQPELLMKQYSLCDEEQKGALSAAFPEWFLLAGRRSGSGLETGSSSQINQNGISSQKDQESTIHLG